MDSVCPNCDSPVGNKFAEAGSVLLLKCPVCGLVFKPISYLNTQDVQELQDSVYNDVRLRTEVEMLYKMAGHRLEVIRQFKKKGHLLEIGCATGEFLEKAQKSGFETLGVDASKVFFDYAKSRGLNVRNGFTEDVLKKGETFDVIVMFHLIEHILDPKKFLRDLKNRLADDGILFIVCPNINSITRKPFGYWSSVFQQPDHLIFFSDKTLMEVCEKAGYKIVSIFTKEYPHAFFSSLRGYIFLLFGPMKKRMQNYITGGDKKIKTTTNKEYSSPKPVSQKPSLYKSLYKKLPYWLGWFFYPVLKPYGLWVEKKLGGHELCLVAVKADKNK